MKKQILFCSLMLGVLAVHAGPKENWAQGRPNTTHSRSTDSGIEHEGRNQAIRTFLINPNVDKDLQLWVGNEELKKGGADLWSCLPIRLGVGFVDESSGDTFLHTFLREGRCLANFKYLIGVMQEQKKVMSTKNKAGETPGDVLAARMGKECGAFNLSELTKHPEAPSLSDWWNEKTGKRPEVSQSCEQVLKMMDFLREKDLITKNDTKS